jgi:hypothetical protein
MPKLLLRHRHGGGNSRLRPEKTCHAVLGWTNAKPQSNGRARRLYPEQRTRIDCSRSGACRFRCSNPGPPAVSPRWVFRVVMVNVAHHDASWRTDHHNDTTAHDAGEVRASQSTCSDSSWWTACIAACVLSLSAGAEIVLCLGSDASTQSHSLRQPASGKSTNGT